MEKNPKIVIGLLIIILGAVFFLVNLQHTSVRPPTVPKPPASMPPPPPVSTV